MSKLKQIVNEQAIAKARICASFRRADRIVNVILGVAALACGYALYILFR